MLRILASLPYALCSSGSKNICIDYVSGGYESGRADTIRQSPISHLLDSDKNGIGAFDFICGSQCSLFRAGDVIDWIFINDASGRCFSDTHTPLCLLFEHIQSKSYSLTGLSVYADYHGRHDIISFWKLLSDIPDYPAVCVNSFLLLDKLLAVSQCI
ncbi:hypothetical protein ACET3Z_006452 [Daucus carota]